MSDAVLVAVVSTIGALLAGVLVELIRARRRTDQVANELTPTKTMPQPEGEESSGTLRDVVNRLAMRVSDWEHKFNQDHDKLIRLETVVEERNKQGSRQTTHG